MQVLTQGHKYKLDWFEKTTIPEQVIQFIEKVQILNGLPGQLETFRNGTTNEDVLAVLIDRIQFLNTKFPCRENSIVLTHLETALLWLNKRTADRKTRQVEGKALV